MSRQKAAQAPRTDRTPRTRLDPDSRREAILAAASDAFAHAPYAEVSLAAIAREVGASEALLHKYFDGKAGLYAEVVRGAIDALWVQQQAANEALPANAPARDRVRASVLVYLDHVAAHPRGWAAPFMVARNDPEAAMVVRREARATYVEALAGLLQPDPTPRRQYALWGYFGFLEAACLAWVERGCPDDDRHALADAALGALEGAIGDWGR